MNKLAMAAMAAGFLVSGGAGANEGFGFSTGLDLNYKRLKMENASFLGGGTIITATDTPIWTLALSPTVTYGRFFASATADRSLGAGIASTTNPTGSVVSYNTTRSENFATVGASVWGGASVFAGYMDNRTERLVLSASGSPLTYKERGPYAGAAYSHALGSGTLVASVAYANADGKFKSIASEAEGTVRGVSASLAWSAFLSNDVVAKIGFRSTRYKFEYMPSGGGAPVGYAVTTKQRYDTLSFGLTKSF